MSAERTEQTVEVQSGAAMAQAIAQEISAPLTLVQRVYEEEYATLASHARLTQFLGVLACRRAKQRLRASGHGRRK